MIDIKIIRENPDLVKENIKKKFQDHKLVLVDEVIALDKESRELTLMCDELRMKRNTISKEIGALMGQGKKEEILRLVKVRKAFMKSTLRMFARKLALVVTGYSN